MKNKQGDHWRNAKQNRIPAVEKTLQILLLLSERRAGLNSKEISADTKISPSTCYRILKTLESACWIFQDEQGGFHIGYGLLAIAGNFSETRHVIQNAQPVLEQLAHKLKVTVKLCAQQGDFQITVAAANPAAAISLLSPIGIPYPLAEAASGSALISHFTETKLRNTIKKAHPSTWDSTTPEEVRERVRQCRVKGWCKNIGKHPRGIDAIACPLVVGGHRFALSMIGLRGDFAGKRLPILANELLGMRHFLEKMTLRAT